MRVFAKYFGIFRNITLSEKDDTIIGEGQNIAFLLKELISRYGEGFKNYICYRNQDEILDTMFIFLNDQKISNLDTTKIKLQDNDFIMIMPLMTNG